jgi:hypothetical protein
METRGVLPILVCLRVISKSVQLGSLGLRKAVDPCKTNYLYNMNRLVSLMKFHVLSKAEQNIHVFDFSPRKLLIKF